MRHLTDYLRFIKENHLEDAARENLRLAREYELPMLEAFKSFPDDILLAQGIKNLSDMADSVADGTYLDKQKENLKKWEDGELQGLPSGFQITPKDLVLAYALQRKTFWKFLPEFAPGVDEALQVISELDEMQSVSLLAAAEVLFYKQEQATGFINTILENIPNMIFVKDAKDLRFVRFNKAGEQLLGVSRNELMGKNDYDFFPKEQADFFTANDREVIDKGLLRDIPEEPIDTKTGKKWLHTRKIPITDKNGKPVFLLGISEDITDEKAALQLLRESEERLRLIVENVQDYAIFMLDPQGHVISWNKGAERIKGYKAEEIIGRDLSVFYTPEEIERGEPKYNLQQAKEKGSYETEGWRVRKNGERFYANVVFTALYDDNNVLKGFAKVTRDITEQKQAEEELLKSNERFFKIFNLSPVATAISEAETGKMLYVNDAYVKMFRLEQKRVIGKTTQELNLIDAQARETAIKKVAGENGHAESMELKLKTADGEPRDLLINLDTIEMDGASCFLSALTDITEWKKSQEEMLRLNVELKAVNKELEAFTYSVSHDLRAPLRAVNGYATMLQEDYETKLDDEGKRLLGVIRYNAEKMGRLIDDLLAFSRLGRKDLDRTEEDMNQLLEGVLIDLKKGGPINAEMRVGQLHKARVDYGLMHQVLLNLVSNAVKYSSKREHPVVEISSEKKNGELIYSVKDNGVGFDMKYSDKLFGVFQRLHSMEEFEGTGVGLAIVQRIISKHNGRVWAEAEKDKGATFHFAIPA